MKNLRWLILIATLAACGLLASSGFYPHAEHWLDNLLYATGIKHVEEAPDFSSDDLQSYEPADYAAYEPLVCEVHHVGMRAEVVPINYGLPVWGATSKEGRTFAPSMDPPREVRKRRFPHAEHVARGGCCVSNLSPMTARIRVCAECEKAEQQWHGRYFGGL